MAKGSKEIRSRIKSVKNTQQLTKAMKMVAASRLRKSEGRTIASRPYTDTLQEAMTHLASLVGEMDHPYLKHIAADVPKVLVLVMSSDRGLCGSFNSNLMRRLDEFIAAQQAVGRQVELVCAGKKGYQHAQREGYPVVHYRESFSDQTTFTDLGAVTKLLTDAYLGQQISEAYMLSARYVNVVKNIPTVTRLLPIESFAAGEDGEHGPLGDYILEPNPEELLATLLPRYFQTVMFQAAIENFTSENGARMVAMDNATNAAGDMINDLTLQYNKARQAGITLELLDIVGGAEALEG